MVDIDSILTEDDYSALTAYRREKKAGKLVSHEKLKKRLVCEKKRLGAAVYESNIISGHFLPHNETLPKKSFHTLRIPNPDDLPVPVNHNLVGLQEIMQSRLIALIHNLPRKPLPELILTTFATVFSSGLLDHQDGFKGRIR